MLRLLVSVVLVGLAPVVVFLVLLGVGLWFVDSVVAFVERVSNTGISPI